MVSLLFTYPYHKKELAVSKKCPKCQNEKPDEEFLRECFICQDCLKLVLDDTYVSIDEQVAGNQCFWASIRNIRKSQVEK